jgi:hypothetical protein
MEPHRTYAGSDEFYQTFFPSRQGCVTDILVDTTLARPSLCFACGLPDDCANDGSAPRHAPASEAGEVVAEGYAFGADPLGVGGLGAGLSRERIDPSQVGEKRVGTAAR